MAITANEGKVSQQSTQSTSWLAVILLWVAGIAAAMQFAKFSISYNQVLNHYQIEPALAGASLSIVGVVGLIFGVTAGIIANKVGYFRVLIGALFVGAIMSFLQSLLPSFEWILLSRLLEGFSQLGVVVAAPTIIALLSAPHHKSLTMGLWGTFFGVAFAISGWAGNEILANYDLSGLYFSHALFILFIALVLLFVLDKNESRYRSELPSSGESYVSKLMSIYRNPRTLLPCVVFLFYTCTLVSLLTYLPNFIEDANLTATLQIVLPLVSTTGTFLAGAISQYWLPPQRVAVIAYIGLGVGALLLMLNPVSELHLCAIFGLMIFSAGLIPGAALSLIPRLARNSYEQGNGYGLIAQLGNLGATVGPPLYAAVIAFSGIDGLAIVALIACGFGGLASFLVGRLKPASE
ncbi:CynX/NimT family MFS transporter [Marinomonas mediterranea]|jgi:Arabinose efflux permease|uniref:Major facilitator superfamily MFS_1 n=1 Tax=Marinomonas mediterranea (strain ATCC 700492 / JCM 21426 / NBRC 103028 / MMB-1) TaxID=717774 RepID=F2JTS8_MARM1|nr:MFS transporter [Marinomonas mediterranea]ADZ92698.1 major facilitator superfamily MFS_1 [Marinomonas mediterranea MMB-1]WCN10633.1 MFS transporter [Marinomonas mediterranea]WCN14690.1 MFS transporter [Marinomonas mediterranea]WCN18729.1 MFS transporter [Marinomonas mediterranea MMB-1]